MIDYLEIQKIRDEASDLCAIGTRWGLTKEEQKDLDLLLSIIRKYEESDDDD